MTFQGALKECRGDRINRRTHLKDSKQGYLPRSMTPKKSLIIRVSTEWNQNQTVTWVILNSPPYNTPADCYNLLTTYDKKIDYRLGNNWPYYHIRPLALESRQNDGQPLGGWKGTLGQSGVEQECQQIIHIIPKNVAIRSSSLTLAVSHRAWLFFLDDYQFAHKTRQSQNRRT